MSDEVAEKQSMSEAQRLAELQSILFGDRFLEVNRRLQQLEGKTQELAAENQALRSQVNGKIAEIITLQQSAAKQAESSNDNLRTVLQTLIDFLHRESLRDDARANAASGLQATQDEFAAQIMNQIKAMRKGQDKQFASLQQTARDGQNDRSATSDHLQSILTALKAK